MPTSPCARPAARPSIWSVAAWVPSGSRYTHTVGWSEARASLDALAGLPWAVPDAALPDHPSVRWRRKHLPKVVPRLELHGVLAVMEAVAAGLAIGVVPIFLAKAYADVHALTDPIDEAETDLWMLAHPESRHLRRIAVVAASLAEHIRLDAAGDG